MPLTLTLENERSLPDGGPLSVTVKGQRGLDIGRDSHLDWTLPDPSRYISGKHCEVRWRDGGFWLHDVSTNGTFLNGADRRMSEPHRLRNGDRLVIGQYIIAVALDGEEARSAPSHIAKPAASQDELWDSGASAPPPIDRRELRVQAQRREGPDFLDWAVDVPPPVSDSRSARRPPPPVSSPEDMAWAPPKPVQEQEPPPAVPAPRRPVWSEAASDTLPPLAPLPPAEAAPPARVVESIARPAPQQPAPDGEAAAPPLPRATPLFAPAQERSGFVEVFANAAGLPPGALAGMVPEELAKTLGSLMQDITGDMMMLVKARADARRMARTASQTQIQAFENNPLKFSPTPEEAMRIMFGPATRSYLPASKAFADSFADLKTHQLVTFTAMQRALQRLIEDMSPDAVEKASEGGRGIGAVIGSSKARAWEAYKLRWQAKTLRHDNGMLGSFMLMFAQAYEEAEREQQ